MDILTQSTLVVAIVTAALGVATLIKHPQTRSFVLFELFCLTVSFWHLFSFLAAFAGEPWRIFTNISMVFSIPLMLHLVEDFFAQTLPAKETENSAPYLKLVLQYRWFFSLFTWALGGLSLFAPILPPWVNHVISYVVPFYTFLVASLLLGLIFEATGTPERRLKTHFSYLFWGGVAVLVTNFGDFLAENHITVPAVGNIVLSVYLYFVYQTVTKQTFLDIRVLTAKSLLLAALTLILSAIYTLFVAWVGKEVGLVTFNTILASFVILVLYEPLKGFVEEVAEKMILPHRKMMQQQLQGALTTVTGITSPDRLADFLCKTLLECFHGVQASVYLLASGGALYRLVRRFPPEDDTASEILSNHPLPSALAKNGPFVTEEYALMGKNEGRRKEVLSLLKTMNVDFLLPFLADGELLGFATLSLQKDPLLLSPTNQAQLAMPLAKQVGIVLKNMEIYRELRERDRLAMLGEMSAGLAHEIRNPLGAIKGAAQCLSSLPENRISWEEREELLKIIIDEVHRLDRVLNEFLGFAKAGKEIQSLCDLNALLTDMIPMLRHAFPKLRIELDLREGLPMIHGTREELERLILNVARNADEAMWRGGIFTISTKQQHDKIKVYFKDEGPGISKGEQERIFEAFYTTKEQGTGLGLPICANIANTHKGKFYLEKGPAGAIFCLEIPTLGKSHES